jgi:hypothetical protein
MALDLTKLSDAELQSISSGNLGSLSDETLRMIAGEAPAPTGDYRVEAARKGVAGSAGMVSGVANVVSDTLSKLGINPLELGMRAAGQPAQAPAAGVVDAYRTGREAVRQPIMQALGSTGAAPQGGGQKIVAAGIEAATSPENYLFPHWQQLAAWGCLAKPSCAQPSKSLWVAVLKVVAKLAKHLAQRWAAKRAQQSVKLPAACWAALARPTVRAQP